MKVPTEPIPLQHLLPHCTSDAGVRFELERQWIEAKHAWDEWEPVERRMFRPCGPVPHPSRPVVTDNEPELLESVKRRHVAAMLAKYGTMGRAAEALGISRATIHNMKRKPA